MSGHANEDQKEVYFLRLQHLLQKYGPEILQVFIKKTIKPNSLKKHKKQLENGATIPQKKILFPQNGKEPDISNFDISLSCRVLQHACGFSGEKKVWDTKEGETFPTMSSNTAKLVKEAVVIRNKRNLLNHASIAKLESEEFEKHWSEVSEAMVNLGTSCFGTNDNWKEKIEDLKTRTLEIVPTEVKNMRRRSDDLFTKYSEEDEGYIYETEQYKLALETIKKRKAVILSGHPGEGKTTLATKIALNVSSQRNCVFLKKPSDWRTIDWSLKLFDTIIIDDIFGAHSLDQNLVDEWDVYLPEIQLKCNCKRNPFKVIITTRHYILEDARQYIDSKVEFFKTSSKDGCVILLTSKELSKDERIHMLKLQTEKQGVDMSDVQIEECVKASLVESLEQFACGFPQCASMFVKNENLFKTGYLFFKEPMALFREYIEDLLKGKDHEKEDKFLALVAVWCSTTKSLNEKDLQNLQSEHLKDIVRQYYDIDFNKEILKKIESSLKSHCKGFLDFNEKTGDYTFNHNVISEMVGVVLGKQKLNAAVHLCPRDFLMKYVQVQGLKDESNEFVIGVKPRHFDLLAEKFARMILKPHSTVKGTEQEFSTFKCESRHSSIWINRNFDYSLVTHQAFQNTDFIKHFIHYLRKNELLDKICSTTVLSLSGYLFKYGISTKRKLDMNLITYGIFRSRREFVEEFVREGHLRDISIDLTFSLLLATHMRDEMLVRLLLSVGARVSGDTIYIAMHHKDRGLLDLLLKHPNVNVNDKANIVNGNYPLMVACRKHDVEVVKSLLEHKANASLKNDKQWTALHKTVFNKRIDVVKLLVENGADVNEKGGKYKRTALHIAADQGQGGMVRCLLQLKANPRIKDKRNMFAVHIAAIRGHCDIVHIFLEADKTLSNLRIASYGKKSFIKGMSLYHIAVWKDNDTLIKTLNEHKANPNIKDFFGQTPFLFAIQLGKTKMYKNLFDIPSMEKTMPQKQGFTPLHVAIYKGHIKLAKKLSVLSNVNQPDKFGRTALHVACEKTDIKMVKFLVECCKADPRMKTKRGDTVYHILHRRMKNISDKEKKSRFTIEMFLERFDPSLKSSLADKPNKKGWVTKPRKRLMSDIELEDNPSKVPRLEEDENSSLDESSTSNDNTHDARRRQETDEENDSSVGSNHFSGMMSDDDDVDGDSDDDVDAYSDDDVDDDEDDYCHAGYENNSISSVYDSDTDDDFY